MRLVQDYDRAAVVRYARQWALKRNPAYYDYEKLGGDCTNFASQCVYAGSRLMNYIPDLGWYYIDANRKAPAWTGVGYFWNFMTRSKPSPGPVGVPCQAEALLPGDLVQLSFDGAGFQHTPVVLAVGTPAGPDNILVAAHSYDTLGRTLASYTFQKLRYLHILGTMRP